MQVSDWLVVVLLVAIVVVLLDGVRRKLRDRRNRVVVKLERSIPAVDGDDDVVALAELPNGGARTLPRNDRPPPTLRNLKSTRKTLSDPPPRRDAVPVETPPVPVLMDTVEVEEERIEHTNVFADSAGPAEFRTEEYLEDSAESWEAGDEHYDDSYEDEDDDDEEDADMLAGQPGTRRPQGETDTRYYGGNDDDYEDDDLDDEEFDEDEEDDDEFEDDDDLLIPRRAEIDDDEDDEFADEDDFDGDEEDADEDDEEDELDEDDEDDDLDELGFPDDNFGSEEEVDLLADDYESEPVLLEGTYDKAASHFNRPRTQRIEPGFGGASFEESELDEDFSAAQLDASEAEQHAAAEAIKPVPLTRRPVPAPIPPKAEAAPSVPEQRPIFNTEEQVDLFRETHVVDARAAAPPTHRTPERPAAPKPAAASSVSAQEAPRAPGPQEVIIINVMARQGEMLAGYELLPVLRQQGLRLGEMSIFHRHTETNGNGPVIFSMANMVKPGTFELAGMEEFTTPGVSFFLQMPNEIGNMPAFELMLGAATAVRNALDGELKDEHRSTVTRQTVEHCRQRIRDFELKLLSKKY